MRKQQVGDDHQKQYTEITNGQVNKMEIPSQGRVDK